MGAVDGRVRLVGRHVQQLRDRPGRRPHRARRRVPAGLSAAPRDADQRDPDAALAGAERTDPAGQPQGGGEGRRGGGARGHPDAPDEGPAAMSDDLTERDVTPGGDVAVPGPEGHRRLEVVEVREGMFGTHGTGDTSGFGGLVRPVEMPSPSERPYGGWFDEVVDVL